MLFVDYKFECFAFNKEDYDIKLKAKKESFEAFINSLSDKQFNLLLKYLKAKEEFEKLTEYPPL